METLHSKKFELGSWARDTLTTSLLFVFSCALIFKLMLNIPFNNNLCLIFGRGPSTNLKVSFWEGTKRMSRYKARKLRGKLQNFRWIIIRLKNCRDNFRNIVKFYENIYFSLWFGTKNNFLNKIIQGDSRAELKNSIASKNSVNLLAL